MFVQAEVLSGQRGRLQYDTNVAALHSMLCVAAISGGPAVGRCCTLNIEGSQMRCLYPTCTACILQRGGPCHMSESEQTS